MDGHEAGSPELGSPDREHTLLEIDIIELQIERFGDAQTRDTEQTQKAMKDPRPQRRRRPRGWQLQRRLQQAPHFLLSVQVGPGSGRSMRQELRRGYLGERIGGATVASKAAYESKSSRPLGGLHRLRLLHPLQSEPCRDVRSLKHLHERDEPRQHKTDVMHLEAQTSRNARYSCKASRRVFIAHLPATAELGNAVH
jgi:hypothetical protein